MGDLYIIEKGLEVDEEIATNGVFRIDASAQLLVQKSMMNPEGNRGSTGGHAGMDMGNNNTAEGYSDKGDLISFDKAKIDKKFKRQLGNVINEYIALKDALVQDDAIKTQNQANKIAKSLKEVDMLLLMDDAHNFWMDALKTLIRSIETIQNSKIIELQRKEFVDLSSKLAEAIDNFGIITVNEKPLYLEFFPMTNQNKGAYWMSYDKEIKNPYFGDKMLNCGALEKHLNKKL